MSSFTQLDVIINAHSGDGATAAIAEQLSEIFTSSGLEARISLAESGAQVLELARRAARGDSRIVVAGGGDGTISTVASVLAGTEKTLGVLPLGTLNHFAKDLRIPLDVEGAVQTIVGGDVICVDVGVVNERLFINNSSLGLYPLIVRQREKHQRLGVSKWPAFFLASLNVLRRYPLITVRLSVGDQVFVYRTPFIFIGNNEYRMEFFNVGSRESLTDGRLSLYIAPLTRRWDLLRLSLRALLGRLNEERDFMTINAKEIWVETRRRRLRVATDGEVAVLRTPLHYIARPQALRVLVPPGSDPKDQPDGAAQSNE